MRIVSRISHTMELTFDSPESAEKWRKWLEKAGVRAEGSDRTTNFYDESNADSDSGLNESVIDANVDDMVQVEHIKSPVEKVKCQVDSYVQIMKNKFK